MTLKNIVSGVTGEFIGIKQGYYGQVTVIRVPDGREYAGPSHEFIKINYVSK